MGPDPDPAGLAIQSGESGAIVAAAAVEHRGAGSSTDGRVDPSVFEFCIVLTLQMAVSV